MISSIGYDHGLVLFEPMFIKFTYIHTYLLLISMLWHRQAIFESKGDKLPSSAECRIRTESLRHQIGS